MLKLRVGPNGNRSELVLYGNDISGLRPATLRNAHNPARIVALGNDMHRDWNTLIAAVDGWPGCEVRIGSTRLGLRRLAGKQVSIVPVRSAREAKDLYAWGEIAVVPLERNLHASGVTVISEAVVSGLPVVCTRTGGLSAYFSEQEVRYVPPEDPEAMRCALKELAANDELRFVIAEKPQKRILAAEPAFSCARAQTAQTHRGVISWQVIERRAGFASRRIARIIY
jgi:glycosyltransferase involved in cell wall biosynthesis